MIGVLLVTHGGLGQDLVHTISAMLGGLSLVTEVIAVHRGDDPDEHTRQAADAVTRLDTGGGVLVLTDAFGATPSNIANRLAGPHCQVVSGLNLPMLIRIYNYPTLRLDAMVASAVTGGRDGIMPCPAPAGAHRA